MSAGNEGIAVAERATGATPIKVRKLGHLVYEVSDVERSRRFWTEIMGFTVSDVNEKGMVFLRCAADHHAIGLKPVKKARRPAPDQGLAVEHLALEVESLEALFEARAFLRAHGIPIDFEGRKGPGCNYSVYCTDPDGYQFELYCDMDQIDERGTTRPASHYRPARSLEEAVANPVPPTW